MTNATDGWTFLKGTPNNPLGALAVKAPFQAPTFTAAGYFYAQSPNTINNCNSCYATGYSTVVGNPDAAYLLPVNTDENGNASLDTNGNPVYQRDATTNAILIGADNKPLVAGTPIDLTVVIEKYLASLGEVNSANLPANRISLQKAASQRHRFPGHATAVWHDRPEPVSAGRLCALEPISVQRNTSVVHSNRRCSRIRRFF